MKPLVRNKEIPDFLYEKNYRVKNWPINTKHAVLIYLAADIEDEHGLITSYSTGSEYTISLCKEIDDPILNSYVCTLDFRTGVIKLNNKVSKIKTIYCYYTSLLEKQK